MSGWLVVAQAGPVSDATMIGLLVSAISVLSGVVVYLQRQADKRAEERLADVKGLYDARIGDRDKHIDRQDRVIEAMTTSLRDLTASVNRLADRVEDIEAPPAPRTRTARRGGG